jgi:hypothetical protein
MAPVITLYVLGGLVAAAAVVFLVMIVVMALRPPEIPNLAVDPTPLQRMVRALTPLPFASASGASLEESTTTAFARAPTPPRRTQPPPAPPQIARTAAPSFAPPSFAPPSFAPPSFAQPSFAQPSFAQPSFAQPSFAQPSFAQPSFAQPSRPPVAARAPAPPPAPPPRVVVPPPQSLFQWDAPAPAARCTVQVAQPAPPPQRFAPRAIPAPPSGRFAAHIAHRRAVSHPAYPRRRPRKLLRFFVVLFMLGVASTSAVVAYPAMLDPLCDDYEWVGAETATVVREHARNTHEAIADFIHGLRN